jgi:hypothetical protein
MGRSRKLRPMTTPPSPAKPTIPERLAELRDLINNQNVDGLNAGQATAIARALDGILADYGTAAKPVEHEKHEKHEHEKAAHEKADPEPGPKSGQTGRRI